MGKIKTVVIGDLEAEEAARKKAEVKREQKKIASAAKKEKTEEKPEEDKLTEPEAKKKVVKKKAAESRYEFGRGKKYTEASARVEKNKSYSPTDGLKLVKATSISKFDGTVELILNVTDKGLRGTVVLPHGTGKDIRVKIADDNLIKNLEANGKIDFDILVADPSMMPKLAKVAKILGPKGLMPNPKTGTIGPDPEKMVKDLASSITWKTEPEFPIVHAILGKVSFEDKKLEENFQALIKSIGKDKIKSAFIKATMGPAIRIV